MGFEAFLFWVVVWLLIELTQVQFAAVQLGLVLSLILSFVALLLRIELDALAYLLLSTYASVFIALALLALHFGPFWAPACVRSVQYQRGWGRSLVAGAVLLLAGAWVGGLVQLGGLAAAERWGVLSVAPLWVEWLAVSSSSPLAALVLLHSFFYKWFVYETLALNLLILWGLFAALLVLSYRWCVLEGRPGGGHAAGSHRPRLVAKLRRQVRRSNSTRLRTSRS